MRRRGAVLVVALLWLAAGARSFAAGEGAAPAAQGTAPTPPPAKAWEFSAAGNGYLFPGEGDFLLGVVTADRGPLHLEARYNYEDRDTASFWGGWTWSAGDTVSSDVTPMLGAVVGDTDAIAPGLEFSLAWKKLDYYLESEIVLDLHDRDDDFVYGWSELGLTPVDWLRVGLVGQRTRVYDTGLDIQRGLLVQGFVGKWTIGVDWFNPASDDEFTVAVLEYEF